MSHNVVLKGVVFRDLEILELAVAELVREGADAVLVKQPTKIRGWARRTEMVDAAIMLPGHKYDLGLKRQPDGSFVPYTEYGSRPPGLGAEGHACPIDGGPSQLGYDATAVGRLVQRYSVIHAERQARKQPGVSGVRRVTNAQGQIQLIVSQR